MEIIDFHDALPGEKHLCEFSIYFAAWGMTFRKFKIMQSAKGHKFVAGPCFSALGSDGSKTWHPYIEFSRKADFDKKVMEMVEPFMRQVSF